MQRWSEGEQSAAVTQKPNNPCTGSGARVHPFGHSALSLWLAREAAEVPHVVEQGFGEALHAVHELAQRVLRTDGKLCCETSERTGIALLCTVIADISLRRLTAEVLTPPTPRPTSACRPPLLRLRYGLHAAMKEMFSGRHWLRKTRWQTCRSLGKQEVTVRCSE